MPRSVSNAAVVDQYLDSIKRPVRTPRQYIYQNFIVQAAAYPGAQVYVQLRKEIIGAENYRRRNEIPIFKFHKVEMVVGLPRLHTLNFLRLAKQQLTEFKLFQQKVSLYGLDYLEPAFAGNLLLADAKLMNDWGVEYVENIISTLEALPMRYFWDIDSGGAL